MSVGPESSEFVAGVVRSHGGLAGLPAGGANFTVLVRVLEGLDHAEDLVHVSTNGQVVHAHLTEHTLFVDDVGSSESDTLIIRVVQKASIIARNALGQVRDHGDVHWTETSLLTRLHSVLSVSEV